MTDQKWPVEDKIEYAHQRIDHLRNAVIGLCVVVFVLAVYLMGRL